VYKFKLRISRSIHLKYTYYSCSLSRLYEKLVEELPALYCFQQLSRPNVALQRALNKQLLNQRLVYPSPLVLRQGSTFFLLNSR